MICLRPARHIVSLPHAGSSNDFAEMVETAYGVWPALESLEDVYPGFGSWYWGKTIPGLLTGKRKLFLRGTAGRPWGVAIAKRESHEQKICTLWVPEEARGAGLGADLLEECLEWLGTNSPLMTVPAERYDAFRPLIKRFGFEEAAQIRSLYRPDIVEHIFNGDIRPASQA